ncbi:Pimeloyl-ACP methyl ester carboxylesterase [Salinibacillus kushneri]|uniref:Pimeloyl-ACP methyl ester carboxylesterase n=1 Tax=Salinibacillus kushneri TaxID=237682 RepID=A0A1I0IHU5_9BACI|nr:alpha/beta fold hydrolase [Salinibacillus kushneri]SET96488.1 Pimeloyl-ACP methyl ester carboxylesterase [Salinibacillus kushneri]
MSRIYFLHGFMGTGSSHFSNQIASLNEENYDLILLDLPGHGSSKVVASDSYFENALEWVITQIKQQGEGYILGLSLGASLAIHVAKREPSLVKGIILTGYSPFIPEELKGIMENQYNFFLNIEENDKNIATHFKNVHGEKWYDTLKKVLYTMTFDYPSIKDEELRNIKVPSLVLNGSEDYYEVEAATYIKSKNKEIKIGLIPNAGHTANIDEPEVYNLLVKEFINNN